MYCTFLYRKMYCTLIVVNNNLLLLQSLVTEQTLSQITVLIALVCPFPLMAHLQNEHIMCHEPPPIQVTGKI
ncbi:hypothetical protein EUGRSUZ_E02862 [Eucalyptus grandis]|uniref:Uncharacterized protein n=2 Tax=Eucalyptus grandis TaxID=71139 RepID=A0ACC3KY50_EUCGR|nr:hypothetical protein EUGRSUZ_E02862 [Eucalyptus grandis]